MMRNLKLYLSCPISILHQDLLLAIEAIKSTGVDIDFWKRGHQYNFKMNEYDGVIFILPGFAWTFKKTSIPSGCLNEMKKSEYLNKPIYLLYKTSDDKIHVYNAVVDSYMITGIPGKILKSEHYKINIKEETVLNSNEFVGSYEKSVYMEKISESIDSICLTSHTEDTRLLLLL